MGYQVNTPRFGIARKVTMHRYGIGYRVTM